MQSINQNSKILNDTIPNIKNDWMFYVALPYSYNPEESVRYAKYYRNVLVNLGVFSYSPICETHTAHVEYMKIMAENLDDDEEEKMFLDSLYKFYIEEDLLKMEMMYKGSTPKRKFALLMGIGWNLQFPTNIVIGKDQLLYDLYLKYKNCHEILTNPISNGVLKEYFWAMQNGIPVYDLGKFIDCFRLKQVQIDVVENQSVFWHDAQNMGLKIQ